MHSHEVMTWLLPSIAHLCLVSLVHADVIVIETNTTYVSLLANFGPPIPINGLFGAIIPVEYVYDSFRMAPSRGCTNSNYTDTSVSPLPPVWIGLVERGDCPFSQKVLNLQKLGASGVVVGDNSYFTTELIRMVPMSRKKDPNVPSIAIPSMFVSRATYFALFPRDYNAMTHSGTFNAQTHPSTWASFYHVQLSAQTRSSSIIEIIAIISLSLAFPMLVVASLCYIWSLVVFGRSSTKLATETDLESLPTRTFQLNSNVDLESPMCAICLEEFRHKEPLRKLNCTHEFHKTCIDPWLCSYNRICPICKRDALFDSSSCSRSFCTRLISLLQRRWFPSTEESALESSLLLRGSNQHLDLVE